MALDPEQFRKKRQERTQQREAARKKRMVRLILAGLLLVSAAVILFLVTRPAAQAGNAPIPEQTAPAGEITTIRIAAVGDLNITDRVVSSGTTVQDYSNMLLDVSHLLSDPHLTLVNLEGVASGPPYGDSRSTPPEMLQALKRVGVDGVQLANSYTVHNGISSLASTISALEETNLLPLGTYRNDGSKPYIIINVQGVRIALVAFTKGTVGMGMLKNGDYGTNILYTDFDTTYQNVDTARINSILSDVRSEKPDLVVAMVHWGSEFNDNISTSQKKIKNLLQSGGVDAIIGTHPHYVQKMELENGKFIAYSLGDFLGDVPRAGTEYSVILNLTVEKNNKTGDTAITGFDYVPTFIVNEEDQPLRVVRLREAIAAYEAGQLGRVSQETYEAMKYALTRVEARVAGK